MKIKLNAAQRLASSYCITALSEGDWFNSLSEEHQKQYVQEHPNSKYAQQYKKSDLVKKPEQVRPKAKPSSKGKRPTAKGKKKPKVVSNPGVVRKIFNESTGIVKGTLAARRILFNDKPQEGDYKKVAKAVGTLLGTAAVAAAIGASGPAAFVGYMALKHLAAPALFDLMQQGLNYVRNGHLEYDDDTDTWHPRTASVIASEDDSEAGVSEMLQAIDYLVHSGEIPKEALEQARQEYASKTKGDTESSKIAQFNSAIGR